MSGMAFVVKSSANTERLNSVFYKSLLINEPHFNPSLVLCDVSY